MVKGLWVPADGTKPIATRDFLRLEDYHAGVDGYIEHVDMPELGISVLVNEEGLLRQLDFNSRVTFLWWYHVPHARNSAMLVGNAVIVGYPDSSGDLTDLPPVVDALITSSGAYGIQFRAHGESTWRNYTAKYADYFEALVWAMVLFARPNYIDDVQVVPWSEITIAPDVIGEQ